MFLSERRLETIYCIADGESSSRAFPVTFDRRIDSMGELKNRIKLAKAPQFDHIPADALNLWLVRYHVDKNEDDKPVRLADFTIRNGPDFRSAARSAGFDKGGYGKWETPIGFDEALGEWETLKLHPMDISSQIWDSRAMNDNERIRIVVHHQL